MDAELLELQRQLESAQQAKSSVRLSDRNVVELVQKLQELKFIDFDLLHTVSGKEYITPDQLRLEMLMEINKSGRVSLIDLSDIIGVDLYHIEKQASVILNDNSGLMLVQGEIISQSYWDTVAEEINDKLQQCSQIAVAELASQLHVGSDLILSVLERRLGCIVKGRLEGGQLYTPAYVARINAMVRGAVRGLTVPTNLSTVWSSLQQLLQEFNGTNAVTVETAIFQSQFNGLLKEGEVLGSVRAGVQWTPTVFAHAQRESVDSFFSQNSFITYDILHKLAIPQPKQYLQSRYPDGIALHNAFICISTVEMIDAAIGDAIENGNWIDSLSVLPAHLSADDTSILLTHCPTIQKELKSSKAVIFGESCIFSTKFIGEMLDKLEKELETLSHSYHISQGPSDNLQQSKDLKNIDLPGQIFESRNAGDDSGSGKHVSQKGSKKKKGRSTGSGKAAENDTDVQENISSKSKKNQRKGKDTASSDTSEQKTDAKKGLGKEKAAGLNLPSEEWVLQHILYLFPDMEGLGGSEDPREVARQLSSHLRPMLVNSWKKKRDSLLMESADQRRRLLDNLQKQLDEDFLNFQLYERALDLFEDDPSISNILHKHLLRTSATSIVDKLLLNLETDNKLMNGVEVEDLSYVNQRILSPEDRSTLLAELRQEVQVLKTQPPPLPLQPPPNVQDDIHTEFDEELGILHHRNVRHPRRQYDDEYPMEDDVKGLPGSLSLKAQAVVESLEDKKVDIFTNTLRGLAEERGLVLKKLDKKLERTLLHLYRKDLSSQVSSETDPIAFLPKVVALFYLQVYNKALQAPGRAISSALSRLKDKLSESTYKVLADYHTATVTLLALQAASTEDEEDCTSDRILSKRELLEGRMPELKGLVLNT